MMSFGIALTPERSRQHSSHDGAFLVADPRILQGTVLEAESIAAVYLSIQTLTAIYRG